MILAALFYLIFTAPTWATAALLAVIVQVVASAAIAAYRWREP